MAGDEPKPDAVPSLPPGLHPPAPAPSTAALSSLDPFAPAPPQPARPSEAALQAISSLRLDEPPSAEGEAAPQHVLTPRTIHADPIRTELHTHYAGVLSPDEYVNAIFLRHDATANLVEAYERILARHQEKEAEAHSASAQPGPSRGRRQSLLNNLEPFFKDARTDHEKAETARYILALRNDHDGGAPPQRSPAGPDDRRPAAPPVRFAQPYALRNELARVAVPPRLPLLTLAGLQAGQPLRAMEQPNASRRRARQDDTSGRHFDEGGVWAAHPEALSDAFTALLRQHDATDGQPLTLYVSTHSRPKAAAAPDARLVSEVLCDTYREHTRRFPATPVRLVATSTTAQVLVARKVIDNRRADGLTAVEMQGNLHISKALFDHLCQRDTDRPLRATFLRGINTHLLNGRFNKARHGEDMLGFAKDLDALHDDLQQGRAVGADINGPESVFSEGGMQRLTVLYTLLAAHVSPPTAKHVLRIHVGEGNLPEAHLNPGDHHKYARNIDLLINTVRQWRHMQWFDPTHVETALLTTDHRAPGKIQTKVQWTPDNRRVLLDPARVEVRLGHVTHLTLDQAVEMVRNRIPVEVNIQSNLATGSVQRADQTPVLTLLLADAILQRNTRDPSLRLQMHLSTDAGGVMGGNLQRERELYKSVVDQFFTGAAHIKALPDEFERLLFDGVIANRLDPTHAQGQRPQLLRQNSLEADPEAKESVYKLTAADFTSAFRKQIMASHEAVSKWPRPA